MNSVFVESMHGPLLVLAVAIELSGLLLVYLGWRRRGRSASRSIAGWMLAGMSLVPWILGAGAGRGIALALALLAVMAVTIIAGTAAGMPPARSRRREPATPREPGVEQGLVRRTLARSLVVGPLGGAVAAALAAATYAWLPGADGNRLLTAFVVLVFGWGGIMAWTAATPSLRRPAIGLTAVLLVTGALLLPLLGTEISS